MTARSRPAAPGTSGPARPAALSDGVSHAGIVTAVGVAVVAAVSQSAGSVVGVATGADPAFRSWPLLVLLALSPAALAVGLLLRGKPGIAAGVLAGAGMVAAGGVIADVQFAIDATRMARPELLLPERETAPEWAGLGPLLAGKALLAVAGVMALRASRSLPDDTSGREQVRQPLALLAAAAGLLLAIGGLIAPYTSNDPLLLDTSALDGPPPVLAGAAVLVLAVPAAAALGVAGGAGGFANGLLGGLALGGLTIALPPLVAAWRLPFLHVTAGPIVVIVGAACLALLATLPGDRLAALLLRRDDGPALPRLRVLYAIAGGLAIASGVCAFAGAMTPLVIGPGGERVNSPAQWLLYPLGLGLGLLGLVAFLPAVAARLRPVFSVAWAAVLLAGGQVLTVPITAEELPIKTDQGAAGWWTFGAIVFALLLAVCSLVAGVVEREETGRLPAVVDADDSGGRGGALIGGAAALAAALSLGAFLLPVARTPSYATTALTEQVDLAYGGVLLTTLAVLGVLLLVPRSGKEPAIALLAAVTGVVVIRLLEWYAVGRRYEAAFAPGALFAMGAVVVLVALVVMVAARGRSAER